MKIVLASGSPRRKELLEMLGVKDMKIIPAVGEESAPDGLSPDELVKVLSAGKAREVAAGCAADETVIAADTIVWVNDRVFGKPHSRAEAVSMLETLSGNTHQVYTGVTIIRGDRELSRSEMSKVTFRTLLPEEIEAYVDSGEPMDKAGAYGAQGKASLFVRGIEGDFFNVMGLPLCTMGQMLGELGISLL